MTLDGTDCDADLRFAGSLVRRVLDRLGATTPAFHADRPRYYHGFDTDKWEMEFSDEPAEDIRIAIHTDDRSDGVVGAHFSLIAPREEAIVATATHIQDYVLEQTHGEPLPPCPEHHHPLQASVIEGVACWVCPVDPTRYAEPIMPAEESAPGQVTP